MSSVADVSSALYRITLQPSGRQFDCTPGETVLDGALRHGVVLPHQCKTGACLSCRAQWLEGDLRPDADGEDSASADPQRSVLLCRARPLGDVTLACRELDAALPVTRLPVRVGAMEPVAADVMVLRLTPPAGQALAFRPGQYVDVLLARGVRRSYSLANAPQPDGTLELHIRHRPGGLFTGQVFGRLKPRDVLRLEGPFGTVDVQEPHIAGRPLLLLATGTGLAPVKALIEACIAGVTRRPVTLYWGGRVPADLYLHALCLQWAQQHPWFRYEPVLSRAPAHWHGRRGHVQQAVCEDFSDLSDHVAYACGSPVMVAGARALLVSQGLADAAFYADAFTAAAA